MAVYLIGFGVSIFILWAIKDWRQGSVGFVFWSFIALLIPCLIAGLRDASIGTDVEVYVAPIVNLAKLNHSFGAFYDSWWFGTYSYKYVADFEIGYVVMVWIVSKITGSVGAVLFCIQLVTIVPIYLGLIRFRDQVPVWLGMAIYYFMFFSYTLNMMRQWMAMGVLFFGVYYLVNRKFAKYLCTALVASLFHTSGLLMGLLILALYAFVTRKDRGTDTKWVLVASIVAVAGVVGLALVARVMVMVGLSDYAGYLGDGQVSFRPNQLLFRLPAIVLLLLNWRQLKEHTPAAGFFVVMAVFDLAASQLGSVGTQSARIALYFSEYVMLSLPMAAVSNGKTVRKYGYYVLIIGYVFAYWYLAFVYFGWGETFPYVFA